MGTENKIYSFYSLIKQYSIRIPALQRAYAQGRNTEKAIGVRHSFIADIKEALDSNQQLSLDNIYGELKEDGTFIPLDGQQRLTTLFLLHVYISHHLGIDIDDVLRDQDSGKSRFSYSTRTASEDFCNYLVRKDFCFSEKVFFHLSNDKDVVQRFIRQDMNFQWSWSFDPTIQSMLNMLDTIHDKFKFTGTESERKNYFRTYWERLISTPPLISFSWQELKNTIPADDLYIRMNARGLALTDFENFKAALYHFLDSTICQTDAGLSLESDQLKSELSSAVDHLKSQIDTSWVNNIWSWVKHEGLAVGNNIASTVDKKLLLLLHICVLFELIKKDCFQDNKEDLVYRFIQENPCFSTYDLMGNPYFTAEDVYSENEIRKKSDLVTRINALMSFLSNSSSGPAIVGQKGKISYNDMLVFYVRYFLFPDGNEINNHAFNIFMNIIHYSHISEFKSFIPAMKTMLDKIEGETAKVVLESLTSDTQLFSAGFAVNQVFEEHLKLKFTSKNKDWKDSFKKAEENNFFKGQFLFLFECLLSDSENNPNYQAKINSLEGLDPCNAELIRKFDRYQNDMSELVAHHSDLLRRALLLT